MPYAWHDNVRNMPLSDVLDTYFSPELAAAALSCGLRDVVLDDTTCVL